MPKSPKAIALDRIQDALRETLTAVGFRKRGRTFSRLSSDGLTEVINFQMGFGGVAAAHDIPGFRDSHEGQFTVNLGVYVPEVEEKFSGRRPAASIREYECCVRTRLGEIGPERSDMWWPAQDRRGTIDDLNERIIRDGLPYLELHSTRDRILAAYPNNPYRFGIGGPPSRIVVAIILLERGDSASAKRLLTEQANEARAEFPGHAKFVLELIDRLGLGPIG